MSQPTPINLDVLCRARLFPTQALGQVYPKSRLQSPADPRHQGNFRRLASARRDARQTLLFADKKILRSLVRHGRQQHRQALYYQKMREVYRMLDRLEKADVEGLLGSLLDIFRGDQG
ncbi:hypothetical protein BJ684DRAFT_18321 [Piptocephalis cylindrospora]|uniref:Nucleolus and neural progenitor protein-like N-terminal domain-containing protein n=1 Tax=Piptocephalis cylindrospora TaxID=1907219 RepID=A0A4P9Y8C6_9FUNG|nr:hypothetical protein BJ684DRAFT_18321 [Piptocephalis cylindrospora]|eukprot:RKP15358.1 hypothetical protein BJ684DRAFT_18321 [Piptocephalis cylindrospora]